MSFEGGKVKLLGMISEGGFGRVYRVELPDGTIVAKKEFHPAKRVLERTSLRKLRERFVREVRVQEKLPSTYFLPVLDSDLQCDNAWFTMPLATRNLAQEIGIRHRERREFDPDALIDILNALEYLHNLGCIHRDLKPENVLLHDDVWKLSDFGLVRPSGGVSTLSSLQSGWGTERYCAPEQARNFHEVKSTADIYSFGVILYDIYSRTSRNSVHQHACSGRMGEVIARCIELQPEDRFPTVKSLRRNLLSKLADRNAGFTELNAHEWVSALAAVSYWSPAQMEMFAQFVRMAARKGTVGKVFRVLDEHRLKTLKSLDSELWARIVGHFCEWCRGDFAFEYCDVLAKRLTTIFEIGDISSRASAVLAMAALGVSHNRYAVMRQLVTMCGKSLDELLATRISIDIGVAEAEALFRAAAVKSNRSVTLYHPRIRGAIDQKPPFQRAA